MGRDEYRHQLVLSNNCLGSREKTRCFSRCVLHYAEPDLRWNRFGAPPEALPPPTLDPPEGPLLEPLAPRCFFLSRASKNLARGSSSDFLGMGGGYYLSLLLVLTWNSKEEDHQPHPSYSSDCHEVVAKSHRPHINAESNQAEECRSKPEGHRGIISLEPETN